MVRDAQRNFLGADPRSDSGDHRIRADFHLAGGRTVRLRDALAVDRRQRVGFARFYRAVGYAVGLDDSFYPEKVRTRPCHGLGAFRRDARGRNGVDYLFLDRGAVPDRKDSLMGLAFPVR